ncbi:hypothetical protein F2P81_000370 [Scophthalmus maximus]|uniref:Uncharacterized protein n=1 Tax=Scophthalmus maximus TaxID=52904 RepID=A0A6A4TIZ4_SCOMX|nr:hypothetical protein F2P81_000370 [Scophthalmus maximus]
MFRLEGAALVSDVVMMGFSAGILWDPRGHEGRVKLKTSNIMFLDPSADVDDMFSKECSRYFLSYTWLRFLECIRLFSQKHTLSESRILIRRIKSKMAQRRALKKKKKPSPPVTERLRYKHGVREDVQYEICRLTFDSLIAAETSGLDVRNMTPERIRSHLKNAAEKIVRVRRKSSRTKEMSEATSVDIRVLTFSPSAGEGSGKRLDFSARLKAAVQIEAH